MLQCYTNGINLIGNASTMHICCNVHKLSTHHMLTSLSILKAVEPPIFNKKLPVAQNDGIIFMM